MKKNTLTIFAIVSVVAFYLGNRVGGLVASKRDFIAGLNKAMDSVAGDILAKPFYLSLDQLALVFGVAFFLITWCIWAYAFAIKGNYRTGVEQGSARWAESDEALAFKDKKNLFNNLIFTAKYGMRITRKKFDIAVDKNMNVLVIGGSGSGKTRYYVKPNLLQLNANYFVTDPKGTLIEETGGFFDDNGYKIKVFNTQNFATSCHYNPLKYVKTDDQILSFVNCLIMNTNGDKPSGGDAFWENSERLLYVALLSYLRDWMPNDYHLSAFLSLLDMAEAKEEDESYESPLDTLFLEIENGMRHVEVDDVSGDVVDPKSGNVARPFRKTEKSNYKWYPSNLVHATTGVKPGECERNGNWSGKGLTVEEDFSLKHYKMFKQAAGKTLKSIIISCNVRVEPLAIREVRNLLVDDEMDLDLLGDKDNKTIIYAVMKDTDATFSFLHAIMMWQTINLLCDRALDVYGGRLPQFTHFIFDEFANIGKLPDIEKIIAVTRSRNIGMTVILQSMAQLKSKYDKDADTIIDCCDSLLFLGGKSTETNKQLSEMIGKETINTKSFNQSKGQNPSYTINHQTSARELITPDEIAKLPGTDALLIITGAPGTIQDRKYPLEKHPRYAWIDPGHSPVDKPLGKAAPAKFSKNFDMAQYLAKHRKGRG